MIKEGKRDNNSNISTLNDALKLLQNCKQSKLNEENKTKKEDKMKKSNEYLRSIKLNDRIKVLIAYNEWESGVVLVSKMII